MRNEMDLRDVKEPQRPVAFIVLFVALYLAGLQVSTPAKPVVSQAAPRLDYTVQVANASQQLFHITIRVTNISKNTIDLSLPSWTPGWYTLTSNAVRLTHLQATDDKGARLWLRAVGKQTWRIETKGNRSLKVDYDYVADNLSTNGAELNEKRGYFLGTNLFLYAVGHTTDSPSLVKFQIPADWRIATGLRRLKEPHTFIARNFDNLVDCPVLMGGLDDDSATVLGKSVHIVSDQQGLFKPADRAQLKELITRVIDSQGKMFGGLPYDDYWILLVKGSDWRVAGALEHENSTNIIYLRPSGNSRFITRSVAHEHFHTWNIKRIKPTALIPYDYNRETYFRELWFGEGVTDYYADLHLLRAGITSPEEFLDTQSKEIEQLQQNEARKWISVADASVTTWATYPNFGPFTVNYYNKGKLIGLLLDLEIRHSTGSQRSLDDVMRYLFRNYYKRGRGYNSEDLQKIVSQIAGRSFEQFFERYVFRTDELDYNAALAYAGFRLTARNFNEGYLGAQFGAGSIVEGLIPGGSAEQAAVKVGDVILALDEMKVAEVPNWATSFTNRYAVAGQPLTFKVKRGEQTIELKGTVRTVERTEYKIVETPVLVEQQRVLRRSWVGY